MTIEQKNPNRTPVAVGQQDAVIPGLNNNINEQETAAHGVFTLAVDSTTETLTSAQFWEGVLFSLSVGSPAPGGAVTLNVPSGEERGAFYVYNNCGETVTVQISGQSLTPPTVSNGDTAGFTCDGVNVTSLIGASSATPAAPFRFVVAVTDETTAITAGTDKITFRMPAGVTLSEVRASLGTAQTSGSIFTVDINEAGTTILSTKLTIDNTEKTSTTAATAAVISDSTLADDAEITIDVDQIGDGTAAGLKVTLIGTYT